MTAPTTFPITEWPESAARWQRTPDVLGAGVSSGLRAQFRPHPLFFSSGQGSRLTDVDGHSYIDYVLGWGPDILGHAHPVLVEEVGKALRRGQSFGAMSDDEADVAAMVIDRIPGVDRVLWSNTGSEVAQTAARLARAATGRNRILKFGGHYHGWSDQFLVGYRPGADGVLGGPASRGQNPAVIDSVEVSPWGDLEAAARRLRDPGLDLAAVFVEPVLANTGVLAPPPDFLEGLRALCDDTGTVLVLDEVITGFRIARGGAVERYAVEPDLVLLAKAIAGGLPLAAVAGKASLIDQVTAGVVHAGTYNGNLTSIAGGRATLTVLGEEGVYDRFEAVTGELEAGLRKAFAGAGVPATVHHVGPVLQVIPGALDITTVDDYLAADWGWYADLLVELLRRGVHGLPGGRWYLSTAHTSSDVKETVAAFEAALSAMTTGPCTVTVGAQRS